MHNEVLFDCETDGIAYTKLHCVSVSTGSGTPMLFTDAESFTEWALENTGTDTLWIAHNACGFDFWAINELTGVTIQRDRIVDTSVLTKLGNYRKYNTHSLAEIGESLGFPKGDFDGGDWQTYTQEMGDYCIRDVQVLQKIWKIVKKVYVDYPEASSTEHEVSLISAEMQKTGFKFNKDKAQALLDEVTDEMRQLEEAMSKQWPAELVVDRTIKWRTKEDGTPYATCLKAIDTAPKWERSGSELVLYKYKDFNPASSKDRVDKLWQSGWKPYDRTDGHIKFERERKKRWTR